MSSAICRGVNIRYIARGRHYGFRRYTLVSAHRSYEAAIAAAARAFSRNSNFKRTDVLLTADYLEPIVLMEMVRR